MTSSNFSMIRSAYEVFARNELVKGVEDCETAMENLIRFDPSLCNDRIFHVGFPPVFEIALHEKKMAESGQESV